MGQEAQEVHPALDLRVEDRVEYLITVSSVATADGWADHHELVILRQYCDALELAPPHAEEVLSFAKSPNPYRLDRAVGRMAKSPARFTLLSDMLFLAWADGRLANNERAFLSDIAEKMGFSAEQIAQVEHFVESAVKTGGGPQLLRTAPVEEDAGPDLVTQGVVGVLALVIGAAAAAAAAMGVTQAGLADDATLGMPILVVAAIATGTLGFAGTQWAYRMLADEG